MIKITVDGIEMEFTRDELSNLLGLLFDLKDYLEVTGLYNDFAAWQATKQDEVYPVGEEA